MTLSGEALSEKQTPHPSPHAITRGPKLSQRGALNRIGIGRGHGRGHDAV